MYASFLLLAYRLTIACSPKRGNPTVVPDHPSDTQGWWGGNSAYQYCPSNGHVVSVRVQLERPKGAGDDTAMSEAAS